MKQIKLWKMNGKRQFANDLVRVNYDATTPEECYMVLYKTEIFDCFINGENKFLVEERGEEIERFDNLTEWTAQ